MRQDPCVEAAAMAMAIARVNAPMDELAEAGFVVCHLRLSGAGLSLRSLPTSFRSWMEDARAGHPLAELAIRLRLLADYVG